MRPPASLGALTLLLGAMIVAGAPTFGLGMLVAGAFLCAWSHADSRARATRALRHASDLIAAGDYDRAAATLDDVEAAHRAGWVRRVTDLQRASISMNRGDLIEAADCLDAALERPVGPAERRSAPAQLGAARALRAFVLASLGRREDAAADVAAVRADPDAPREALARVILAEALLLECAGDVDGVRKLLVEGRALLADSPLPHERPIARAHQRMVRLLGRMGYRDDAGSTIRTLLQEPPLAEWVAATPFDRITPPDAPADAAPARIAAPPSPAHDDHRAWLEDRLEEAEAEACDSRATAGRSARGAG